MKRVARGRRWAVDIELVAAGEAATATMQLERAGDHEVSTVLDDGTITVRTEPTSFTVEENLDIGEPEISPEDEIAKFLPAPIGFDLDDSLGADVDVPLLGDPCEDLFDDLCNQGSTAAAIISTWVIDGIVVSGQLAGGAKRAVDGFKRALLDRPIHLPLDFGLLPDALSMADAPRFREGVGPADQVLTPSDYDYDPTNSDFRVHDYCSYVESWSYDTQFFGPCARHDKCIDDRVGPDLEARYKCDGNFGDDLNRNCYVQNPPLDRSRSLLYAWCASTANAMWAAVTAKGLISP